MAPNGSSSSTSILPYVSQLKDHVDSPGRTQRVAADSVLPASSTDRTPPEPYAHSLPSALQQNGHGSGPSDHRLTSSGNIRMRRLSSPGIFNMKMESERRKTFRRWPVPFMDPDKLAAAGFYYLNKDDIVSKSSPMASLVLIDSSQLTADSSQLTAAKHMFLQIIWFGVGIHNLVWCAFCGVEIGHWEEGDDAMRDHQRWGPHCPFLRKFSVGNVPLAGGSDEELPANQSYDTCGPYGIEIHPFSGPEKSVLGSASLEKLGVNKTQGPVFPQYASIDARFKSFDGWPLSLKQRPDKLSEAGFYYTGKGDQTVCFHCGGGLKDWEDDDDPWMEHALWFSKCTYVLLVKGRQFVEQVCAKRDPLMSGEQVLELETPAPLVATTPK
uniref:Uncharacterized protein n=1 Tax=Timema bartmani TaxID=61472 RepID=A0A7R9I2C2_9NEOP|nr:unnamed protein product [Timema bartmani]